VSFFYAKRTAPKKGQPKSIHFQHTKRANKRTFCRYISRRAVSEKRLSLTSNGNIRCQLKTPYRDGTTHVIFEPLDFMAGVEAQG
jgi:hypothetical protein